MANSGLIELVCGDGGMFGANLRAAPYDLRLQDVDTINRAG